MLIHHLGWRDLLQFADHVITDPPYSDRTHVGNEGVTGVIEIPYASWSPTEARDFGLAWGDVTRGWIVILTDHVLWPHFAAGMADSGRYVFSPIACVETGSRVRMQGDGPAQWSTFACVSRPRGEPYSKWGALPGAYVGKREAKALPGGKPRWLMDALVRDYTRRGDLVCDPCCGAGTTLVSALAQGRRVVGGDIDEAHVAMARAACGRYQQELFG